MRSSHGLLLLPPEAAQAQATATRPPRELALPHGPSLAVLDRALADIGTRYGAATERYVALEMEYAPRTRRADTPGRCRATTSAQGTNRRARGLPRRVL